VSLAVSEGYRRRGVARHLMLKLQDRMLACHGAATCSLHVRRSNQEAVALYRDVLGYGVVSVAEQYYKVSCLSG
jgi:N-alpha-acetyltransferase 10/11